MEPYASEAGVVEGPLGVTEVASFTGERTFQQGTLTENPRHRLKRKRYSRAPIPFSRNMHSVTFAATAFGTVRREKPGTAIPPAANEFYLRAESFRSRCSAVRARSA